MPWAPTWKVSEVRANAIFALNLFPKDKLSSASTNLTQVLNRAVNDNDPVVRSFALEIPEEIPSPLKYRTVPQGRYFGKSGLSSDLTLAGQNFRSVMTALRRAE
jgi:hypothetical protein